MFLNIPEYIDYWYNICWNKNENDYGAFFFTKNTSNALITSPPLLAPHHALIIKSEINTDLMSLLGRGETLVQYVLKCYTCTTLYNNILYAYIIYRTPRRGYVFNITNAVVQTSV